MALLTPPLPPNRTGGSPASGSPVSGLSSRLNIGAGAMFQTEQAPFRKPAVGPPSAICLTQPVAGSLLPFAQHRSQATPQPAVRPTEARAMTVSEVAIPTAQGRVDLGNNLARTSSVGAPCQRSQLLLQFLEAFLARPFLPPAEVPGPATIAGWLLGSGFRYLSPPPSCLPWLHGHYPASSLLWRL
jgi:hypothetical protein